MNIVWHSGNEIPELHEVKHIVCGFEMGLWQESDTLILTENGTDYELGVYVIDDDGGRFCGMLDETKPIAWAYVPVLDEGAVKVFERMARKKMSSNQLWLNSRRHKVFVPMDGTERPWSIEVRSHEYIGGFIDCLREQANDESCPDGFQPMLMEAADELEQLLLEMDGVKPYRLGDDDDDRPD